MARGGWRAPNTACVTSPVGGEALTDDVIAVLQKKDINVRPRYMIKRVETAPGVLRGGECAGA